MVRRPLAGRRSPQRDIVNAIAKELGSSGSNIGYRKMHRYLPTKAMICRCEDVRVTVKELDPEGVSLRRRRRLHRRKYISKGPNYTWHIDGHDKSKPFGFSVHGCIDGFSRKLIWLKVGSSNKNPDVIAHYYLDASSELGGMPMSVPLFFIISRYSDSRFQLGYWVVPFHLLPLNTLQIL